MCKFAIGASRIRPSPDSERKACMKVHDHRQNKFGNLLVQPVVDDAGNRLGWAIAALIDDGGRAEYLVLHHFQSEPEAWSAKQGALDFLAANHRLLSKL